MIRSTRRGLGKLPLSAALLCLIPAACDHDEATVRSLQVLPSSTPLPQSEAIPIEVEPSYAEGEWKTVSASREGLEQFALTWCSRGTAELADRRLCQNVNTETPFSESTLDISGQECLGHGICHLRRQICAGAYLAELARSPVPRTTSAAELNQEGILAMTLGIPESQVEALGLADHPVTRVRFQPLTGPGQAAAFRGSLNRYREAARIASVLQNHVSAASGTTCLQTYLAQDAGPLSRPALPPDEDATLPTWPDVFVQGWLDATFEFSSNLARAVEATRSAGDS
jgi:hypothetical protein